MRNSLKTRIGPLKTSDKIIFILTNAQYIVHIIQRFTKILWFMQITDYTLFVAKRRAFTGVLADPKAELRPK